MIPLASVMPFVAFTLLAAAKPAPPALLEDSVVKVFNYSAPYDYAAPWRQLPVNGSSGTGFVIAGNKIITNAHVVRDARQVMVQRHNAAEPFIARIEAMGNDCDLALLRVDDPAFAKGLEALPVFTGLPAPRSQVTTYGYPTGGQELSSTTGIVSRIETRTYVHSQSDEHLAVQTDAAINPGNSGGPVIQNGKVVGVAFQNAANLQSTGYFIPALVLQHFLDDLNDGRYDGFPDLGASTSSLLSAVHRRERGLPAGVTGALVDAVVPGGTADGVLRPFDVLLAVDGQVVDNEGKVRLGATRVPLANPIDLRQVGSKVRLSVWREGKKLDLEAVIRRVARWERRRNRYGDPPKYLVYAGLVFMVVDRNYLKTWGEAWPWTAPRDMIERHLYTELLEPARAEDEVVVLARVLKHPANSQMSWTAGIVEQIDGKAITSLGDAARVVDEARARGRGHLVLRFTWSALEALDLADAERAHPQILETYGIASDRNL